ncbi:hypothetical protein Ae707Ps1_6040c [Pseudonocardia sp. Ae707_Ps1]|nr:hypothetical protein Ae707Ps1_6040c [Pseudonocardia sp. Ae707_Ps1]
MLLRPPRIFHKVHVRDSDIHLKKVDRLRSHSKSRQFTLFAEIDGKQWEVGRVLGLGIKHDDYP